jgi:membrane-bound lytic murein transglycosylase A
MTVLAACETAPIPRPYPLPPTAARRGPPPQHPYQPAYPQTPAVSWSELPGWAEEDHMGAMAAVSAACEVSRDPAMLRICAEARSAPPINDRAAKAFIEANFRLEPVPGEGVLTAYFTPVYEARTAPEPPFTSAVRPKPAVPPRRPQPIAQPVSTSTDPPASPDAPQAAPHGSGDDIDSLLNGLLGPDSAATSEPASQDAPSSPPPAYPYTPSSPAPQGPATRADIDNMPAPDALAWMRPEDLFFMQIQGSGILVMPDGRRLKASVAGSNALPFVPIARTMRQQGLLDGYHTSGDSIHDWLAAHRGPEADAVMEQNPRYIYFRLKPDDGLEPPGAAGVPLPPGRSLAMDLGRHSFGELYWIDAEAPTLSGAFPVYRRVAAHLDIGAAIKGEVRADLFTGIGDQAGREAGRVRHTLRLLRLAPSSLPEPTLVAAP